MQLAMYQSIIQHRYTNSKVQANAPTHVSISKKNSYTKSRFQAKSTAMFQSTIQYGCNNSRVQENVTGHVPNYDTE